MHGYGSPWTPPIAPVRPQERQVGRIPGGWSQFAQRHSAPERAQRAQPGPTSARSVLPPHLHSQPESGNAATRARRSRSRRRKTTNLADTAFPALRPLGPSRSQLSRGKAEALNWEERKQAMRDVIHGVYAESTHAPMEAKMRTNRTHRCRLSKSTELSIGHREGVT